MKLKMTCVPLVWVACLVLAPTLMAQKQLVGETGPAFEAGDMLFDSGVYAKSLADTVGEVVLIKYWGLKCGPCKAAMPGIQRLWTEYKDRGLHIFHIESQGHSAEEIAAYCDRLEYAFPQTLRTGGSNFAGYPGGNGLPYAFLVGVDGKVVWQGRHGYEPIIAQEIAKVRYPGLGRMQVAHGLEKAAKLFGARKFASAIAESEKRLAKADEDAELAAGARYIIERAQGLGERMKSSAESASKAREYGRALDTYQQLARSFKGLPLADRAKEQIAFFRKEKRIKKELQAEQALESFLLKVNRAPTRDKQVEMLHVFAQKFDGTKAAERALQKAKLL